MKVLVGAVAFVASVACAGSIANAQRGDDCREVVRASATAPGTGPIA